MAKPKYVNQAIGKYEESYVGKSRLQDAMLTDADVSGTRREVSATERLRKPLCPRHELANRITRPVVPQTRHRHSRFGTLAYLLILVTAFLINPTSAVFISFENCLPADYQNSDPLYLQFQPKFLDARFDTTNPNHTLQVTVYGSVNGSGTPGDDILAPSLNNTDYWTSNATNFGGKIEDIPDPNAAKPHFTTLFNKITVLTYVPYNQGEEFCQQLINATCPLGPNLTSNGSVFLVLLTYGDNH